MLSLDRYQDDASIPADVLRFTYTGARRDGWGYDPNGNVTYDPLRNFEISHNLLNLPCEVRDSQDNMKMRYTYISDGTKVSALDAAGDGMLYRGSFVYGKDGQNVNLEDSVPKSVSCYLFRRKCQ